MSTAHVSDDLAEDSRSSSLKAWAIHQEEASLPAVGMTTHLRFPATRKLRWGDLRHWRDRRPERIVNAMTTTPTPLPALDRFYRSLRRSPVTRSPQRAIAGVCSGAAERLGLSTTVVRVATVVLAILGPAVAVYFLAWLLLPDSQGHIRLERALRGGDTSSIVLLVATIVVILPDAGVHARFGWFSLVLVAAVAWVFYQGGLRSQRHGTTSTKSTPPPAGPNSGPTGPPSV